MKIIDIIKMISSTTYESAEDLVLQIFSSLGLGTDQLTELLQIATTLRTKNLSMRYPEYSADISSFTETLGMLHKILSRFLSCGITHSCTFLVEKLTATTLIELQEELTELLEMYSADAMCIWKQVYQCCMPKTFYPLIEFTKTSCERSVGILHGKENTKVYSSEGYGYTTSKKNYAELTGKKTLQLKPLSVYPLVISAKSQLYREEYKKPGASITEPYANIKIPVTVTED